MMYVACFFVGIIFGIIMISTFAVVKLMEAKGVIDRLRIEIKTLKQYVRWAK